MKSRIASLTLFMALGYGIAQQPPTTMKKVPVRPTTSVAGKDLYREYCAVCHGPSAKGDGPAAAALKTPPPDLTVISQKNHGKFPEVRVQGIINGEASGPVAHGSKDMPVWGDLFRHMDPNQDVATVRVFNLMKYLESIQVK